MSNVPCETTNFDRAMHHPPTHDTRLARCGVLAGAAMTRMPFSALNFFERPNYTYELKKISH
jgi:hypothetical protein